MTLDKKKTLKNLKSKGFVDAPDKSDDHHYLEFIHEGKLVCYTKISHGSGKDIGIPLILQMARQCKLSKSEFADLVNCPLSQEAYLDILAGKNLLI